MKTLVIDWSGRQDLNLRPLVPQTSALPDCATPRSLYQLNEHLLSLFIKSVNKFCFNLYKSNIQPSLAKKQKNLELNKNL